MLSLCARTREREEAVSRCAKKRRRFAPALQGHDIDLWTRRSAKMQHFQNCERNLKTYENNGTTSFRTCATIFCALLPRFYIRLNHRFTEIERINFNIL